MDDTVYRQAAIDAAKDWYNGLICGSFIGLEKRLRALPSVQPDNGYSDGFTDGYKRGLTDAQPEIIHCKDCKWKNRHNCTRAVEVIIDDDKYCAWAERREE